jgi:phospholipid/cholesterol/gamma-HCH transport system substrate-binding protein
MAKTRHMYLGLFFVAVAALLGGYTLFLTEFSLFSEKTKIRLLFSNTSGLREGDSVLVAGMRWGKVESLTFDPEADLDNRIAVVISLTHPVDLHDDARITIRDSTLLGGKVLAIEPGTPGLQPLAEPYRGDAMLNVLDALGDVVEENRAPFREAIAAIRATFEDVRGGEGLIPRLINDSTLSDETSQAITNINATFSKADELFQGLQDGTGTFGRLFQEDTLYLQLEQTVQDVDGFFSSARELVEDARTGEGLLAAVINDPKLAEDARVLVERIREVATRLGENKSLLGRLINDPVMGENLDKIVAGLAAGEGTLGRLLTEDELYANVDRFFADLAEVSKTLAEGRGTIGRLIMDDEIYMELQKAIATLTGSLEEAREAAPITTFLNTLFLGF